MSLTVKELRFSYTKQQPVLNGLSFELDDGFFVCLLGANGVGKSTLLRCMLGLERDYSGSILIDGADIKELSRRELARRIAYIPQSSSPGFNYTVRETVLMGTTAGLSAVSPPSAREREAAERAMEDMGIRELADRGIMSISGGERQLALIARALAQKAEILLMDEPTANLDFGNQVRVLTRLRELTQRGYTVLQSTHDPAQAFLYADRVLALSGGRLCADGAPDAVIDAELVEMLYGVPVTVGKPQGMRAIVCVPEQNAKQSE